MLPTPLSRCETAGIFGECYHLRKGARAYQAAHFHTISHIFTKSPLEHSPAGIVLWDNRVHKEERSGNDGSICVFRIFRIQHARLCGGRHGHLSDRLRWESAADRQDPVRLQRAGADHHGVLQQAGGAGGHRPAQIPGGADGGDAEVHAGDVRHYRWPVKRGKGVEEP